MCRFLFLIIPLLAGCVSVPRATSIKDYCGAVALEAEFYAEQRGRLTILDINYRIEVGLSRYPRRERDKMMDVARFVYGHPEVGSEEVGRRAGEMCLRERADGTWYG